MLKVSVTVKSDLERFHLRYPKVPLRSKFLQKVPEKVGTFGYFWVPGPPLPFIADCERDRCYCYFLMNHHVTSAFIKLKLLFVCIVHVLYT